MPQGSNGIVNLSGDRKLEAIRARFGDDFAELGNDHVDLPIWRASKASLVVGSRSLRDKATAVTPLEAEFPGPGGRLRAWRKGPRLHQWAKNALIFAPIALAGPMATPEEFAKGLLGFIVFGLLASVGYIINDLLDLPADRRHANKRYRPFAAGLLAPKAGVTGAALMLVAASLLMSVLGPAFTLAAVGYFVGTIAYSLKLKRKPMLDVLILAALFTVRVVAGTTLTVAPLSYWLITFSTFLFLSLALVKRYAELADQPPDDNTMRESRGYSQLDAPLLLPFGAGSALASCLIFVVYLVEERFPSNIYGQPGWLWFVFPVLMYWLMRIWRLAVHGKMHQDPVLFALRDPVSLALGAIVLVLVLLAW
jgi:4-hydroxybenzoate polyprenyltransferase